MRITFYSILGIGLLAMGTAFAQFDRFTSTPEWQSLKIMQTVEPVFPPAVMQTGVSKGMVQMAINTDPDGKLVEALVTAYSRKEFADSAMAALKQWRFEPARLRGEKVGTTVELTFDFEAKGVVVSMSTLSDAVSTMFALQLGTRLIYQPCSLRELDRIPTPIVSIAPAYPQELADRGLKGRVTVDFYIDEMGAVRVPSVSINDDPVLTSLAVSALRQWRFEPPTRNGRPALVRASQAFNFGSK